MHYTSVVLQADTPNKNRRIYPRKLLENQVEYLRETVSNRGMLGQINYPPDCIIRVNDVSHVVTNMRMEGDNLVADIEILPTPNGQKLREMIESGQRIALRPLGVGNGTMDENGNLVLNDSYKMISISVVRAEDAS